MRNTDIKKSYTGKPLQLLSYDEKMANDKQWGKAVMDYYIDNSLFNTITTNSNLPGFTTKKALYDAYNNILPTQPFDYVTNPLNSEVEKFKKFPAQIRPYNILRPNVDLYIGEWNKRPFKFDVVNMDGEDVLNTFTTVQTATFKKNVTQRWINTLNELGYDTAMPSEELPNPNTVIQGLNGNYKDAKALDGYKSLKVISYENRTAELWRVLFKDWLIAGEVFTLKIPHKGKILYLRLSPLFVDYDKSSLSPYVEDGEYAVARFRVTVSDLVDLHYDELTKKDIENLENGTSLTAASKVFGILGNLGGDVKDYITKNDLYYVTWKSKKQIGILTYPDPATGEVQMMEVDESYVADKEKGEVLEKMWVNDVWHGWKTGDATNPLYLGLESLPTQRSEQNNYSSCKLPINGKRFSDTESSNVSIVWLGMAYQIMYIIMQYRIELTVAKSKGKIVLMDGNAVNDDDHGGEEQFLWYAESMGWAFVYRDQEGVDRSMNQYGVLDLSLFADIKQLIEISEYVKSQWDELLGITRGRKGQTTASDQVGTTNASIIRSTVISDLIFTGFEEFLETELQGLLDISKFAWAEGKKGHFRNDAGAMELLNLNPEHHTNASYGVFVQNISNLMDRLELIKNQVNAIAQRKDVKPSTIIDIATTESFTELKALMKQAEAVEESIISKREQAEGERQQQLEQMRQDYQIFLHGLEVDKQEKDHDRLDNREYIKASLDKDPGAGIDPYLGEVQKASTERLKTMEKSRLEERKIELKKEDQNIKREEIKAKERMNTENNKTKMKNKVSGEK